MSVESQPKRPIGDVQARHRDPLAELDSDQVLRCEDPETGWLWFYDRDGDEVRRYHERDDYHPRATSTRSVAVTVALDSVESCAVSRVHLEVRTGDSA